MKTIELFSGTESFSKVMRAAGHRTYTIEKEEKFNPDLCMDILDVHPGPDLFHDINILWASPPCQGFSVAVIGRNWNYDRTPKTDSARLAMQLAQKTIELIKEIKPRYYFIENPRGMLRKMPFMEKFLEETGGVRHTVAYCQYGDRRQKPTDIWTNALWWHPRPMCKPGSSCHDASPRGSNTSGTQGMGNRVDRSRIPPQLFEEILSQFK